MLKKYEYGGQHHTMVVLEKGQTKVRVEPNEVVETELALPKHLFKLLNEEEAKKKAEAEEQAKKETEAKAKAKAEEEAKKKAEAEAKKKK